MLISIKHCSHGIFPPERSLQIFPLLNCTINNCLRNTNTGDYFQIKDRSSDMWLHMDSFEHLKIPGFCLFTLCDNDNDCCWLPVKSLATKAAHPFSSP